jgi:two-component system CheB/CheR fusion protein
MKVRWLSYPAAVLATAAVYFGAGKLGLSVAVPGVDQVTLVWPPTGIALAVLLIFGNRFWPGIALGAFLVNFTTPHESLFSAGGIATGNTLEAVLGAWLLRWAVRFDNSLERLKDVVAFIVLAAGVSTTVSATVGVTVLCLAQAHSWHRFGELWSNWWLGDAMGDLVMAPVLLTWLSGPRPRWQTSRFLEAAALGAGLILVCQFVFVAEVQAGARNFPLEYTIFPFVIWAALRFGQRGVTLVTFVTSAIAIAATLQSFGPFAKGKGYGDSMVLLQVFMGVVVVTGLLLGGVMSENRRVERRRAADFAIGQILTEAMTLHEAAPRIVQTICEMLDWDLGALWMVKSKEGNLHCADMWHKPTVPIAEFVQANRTLRFQPGQGLPGRVWSLGRPVWITNVIRDANFPRAAIATRVGLRGAFGFPVLLQDKILGVLEFFSQSIRSPDPDLLRMVAGIGRQLGQFIDRREAEENRRTSEERLRLALGAGHMGVWDWNIQTGELKWSESLGPMLGLAPGSFGGTLADFLDLIHPDDREQVKQSISRAIGEGQDYEFEFRNLWPDGSLHWIAGNGRVFHDPSGKAVRMIGIGMDITERKVLEQELEQRVRELAEGDRRKDEFLAMLAHELRNPLAPIRNALQILKTPAAEPALREMARDVLDRQTSLLARLVDDLMDVSRITRGKINLNRETIELATVVKRAIETARPLIEEQEHQLSVSLPPEPIYLSGDLVRLAQALANILNNAAKYTEKHGRIFLSAEVATAPSPCPLPRGERGRGEGEVAIWVRDTGIGIAPEMLPRIFDLFTQADRSLDRSQGGLGIGLTLVRSLVDMHGGTVQAASAGPGQGSEFIVRLPTLPISSKNGKGLEEPAPLRDDRLSRRVLIIDDNRDSTETLASLMRIWNHEVKTAQDGPSALAAAESFHPDVVFLDIGLPGMNGFEVAKRLRRLPDLPQMLLVALSGYSQDGDRFQAQEAGFDHYLVKPVGTEIIQDFLITGLQKAKQE